MTVRLLFKQCRSCQAYEQGETITIGRMMACRCIYLKPQF